MGRLSRTVGASSLINTVVVEGQVRSPIEIEHTPYGLKGRFKLRLWAGEAMMDMPCRCLRDIARQMATLKRPYPRAVVSGRLMQAGGSGPQDPPYPSILVERIVLVGQDYGTNIPAEDTCPEGSDATEPTGG